MTSAASNIENLLTNGDQNSEDEMAGIEEDNIDGEQASTERNLKHNLATKRLVNPILYTRGLPSEDFYLILSGKVVVCSGNEGFMIEQS